MTDLAQLELDLINAIGAASTVAAIEEVRVAARDLTLRTRAQRGELPFMHPGRVDVIGAGALLWHRIIERVEQASGITAVTVSESDILDGTALDLAERHLS